METPFPFVRTRPHPYRERRNAETALSGSRSPRPSKPAATPAMGRAGAVAHPRGRGLLRCHLDGQPGTVPGEVGPLRAWEAEPSLISERTGARALLEPPVLCASAEAGGLEAEDEQ